MLNGGGLTPFLIPSKAENTKGVKPVDAFCVARSLLRRSMIEQKRRIVNQRPRQILGPERPRVGRDHVLGDSALQARQFLIDGAIEVGDFLLLLVRALLDR